MNWKALFALSALLCFAPLFAAFDPTLCRFDRILERYPLRPLTSPPENHRYIERALAVNPIETGFLLDREHLSPSTPIFTIFDYFLIKPHNDRDIRHKPVIDAMEMAYRENLWRNLRNDPYFGPRLVETYTDFKSNQAIFRPHEGDTRADFVNRMREIHRRTGLETEDQLMRDLPQDLRDHLQTLRGHSRRISSWHAGGIGLSLAEATLNMRRARHQENDDGVLPVYVGTRREHEQTFENLESARRRMQRLTADVPRFTVPVPGTDRRVLTAEVNDVLRKTPPQGLDTYTVAIEREIQWRANDPNFRLPPALVTALREFYVGPDARRAQLRPAVERLIIDSLSPMMRAEVGLQTFRDFRANGAHLRMRYVQHRLRTLAQRNVTPEMAEAVIRYFDLADFHEPSLLIEERIEINPDRATHGNVSADVGGQGGRNIEETMRQAARHTNLADALAAIRRGEQISTNEMNRLKENFRTAAIRADLVTAEEARSLLLFTGDDGMLLPNRAYTQAQQAALLRELYRIDPAVAYRYRIVFLPQNFSNANVPVVGRSAIIVKGEGVEKNIRTALQGRLTELQLRGILVGINMEPRAIPGSEPGTFVPNGGTMRISIVGDLPAPARAIVEEVIRAQVPNGYELNGIEWLGVPAPPR